MIVKKASAPAVMASPEYRQFIEDLKARVVSARLSAARAVSRDLILLYWDIGRGIVDRQRLLGWGESVVEMVAADLRRAFPGSRGFSSDNVWRMRQFHIAYSDAPFLGQTVPEMASAKTGTDSSLKSRLTTQKSGVRMRTPAAQFEDLVVWQEAHQFALGAYRLSRKCPRSRTSEFRLLNRVCQSSSS